MGQPPSDLQVIPRLVTVVRRPQRQRRRTQLCRGGVGLADAAHADFFKPARLVLLRKLVHRIGDRTQRHLIGQLRVKAGARRDGVDLPHPGKLCPGTLDHPGEHRLRDVLAEVRY